MARLSSSQNARSSWPGMMPRSRQISAMTAPTGRRRTSAAISASVGRRVRRGSSGWLAGWGSGGAWPAGGGLADGWWREVVAAGSAPAKRGFQGGGATQAAGDAGEDGREVGGAEGFGEQCETWRGSALVHCAGELPAVADQFADDAEDTAEGGGHGRGGPRCIEIRGWGGGLGAGGHGHSKNTEGHICQGKYSFASDPRGAPGGRNDNPIHGTGSNMLGGDVDCIGVGGEASDESDSRTVRVGFSGRWVRRTGREPQMNAVSRSYLRLFGFICGL
jgi:hypothetical protein